MPAHGSHAHGVHAHKAPWIKPMRSRDPREEHRVSTPLELLFDLCFVVAVSQAASHLHHGIVEDHVEHALLSYGFVFFSIWWAWMNFSWFASAYDCDDVPYRLGVLVQIAGVLVLAAGVPRAFDEGDFTIVTIGYVLMRVGLVSLWLRAARNDPKAGAAARRYALGVSVCQVGWVALLALPPSVRPFAFLALAVAEMCVPMFAERAGQTTWHPHHISERFGLLTLIVLGESVLSATVAIQAAIDDGHFSAGLASTVAGALLLVFSMWWLYFDSPVPHLLVDNKASFRWGYGHLVIFAAVAAVGAGLGVSVDVATGHAHVSSVTSAAALAVPVAAFLFGVWALIVEPSHRGPLATPACLGAVALVGASVFSPLPVLTIGVVVAVLVALSIAFFPAARAHH